MRPDLVLKRKHAIREALRDFAQRRNMSPTVALRYAREVLHVMSYHPEFDEQWADNFDGIVEVTLRIIEQEEEN